MYADIKTCLGTIWKNPHFFDTKREIQYRSIFCFDIFLKSYSQKEFLTRIFADIGRNLPT